MKMTYDSEVDVLRFLFSDNPIEESDEEREGVIFDYDKEGKLVGMEILDACKNIDNPYAVEYAITPFPRPKASGVGSVADTNVKNVSKYDYAEV